MIVQREEEIKKFVPAKFFEIKCLANNVEFNLLAKDGNSRIFNKEKRDSILNKLKGEDGIVNSVQEKIKKINAPYAYDLTTLQIDANNKYGFSAKRTLQIMQQLYEHHKVVTYPRTDSKYISKDIVPTLKERLESITSSSYRGYARALLRTKLNISNRFVDDKKVTDHHAIIPTEQTVFLNDLSSDERKIYDLIVKRFLEVLSQPCEYKEIKVRLGVKDELFNVTYKNIINQGWKQIGSGNDDIKNEQIKFKKNDKVKIDKIFYNEGSTKPPSRYTEALLLGDMENPRKFVKEDKMKETLSNVGGIGTVATRADIIEKLFNSYLIEKKGKDICITSKGKQLLNLVPKDLKSPALTARWEQKLESISKGKINKNIFVSDMRDYTKEIVNEIKNSKESFKHDNLTRSKCPECGKYLLEVNGKRGKMLVCQDRECGYKKGIAKKTNARCPNCHKKMELRGEGEGQIFVCGCGHREKLTSFKKRKEEKKSQGNKRDVAKYLKNQKKNNNEPINTALADALAKFKFN
jgi:DNA topoisomerase-3